MKKLALLTICLFFALILLANGAKSAYAALYGIDWDTGNLYTISTTNASLTLIGSTGLTRPGSLEFSPSGTLYTFTIGDTPTLYTINPDTAAATAIGPLGLSSVYEGGLAFSPSGTAYGVNNLNSSKKTELFTLNLNTGAATVVGTIFSDYARDFIGLAWRSDGKLVGIDSLFNSLYVIDPATGSGSLLMEYPRPPLYVGPLGGMTGLGSTGFFSTGGPGGSYYGTNSLYSFDLFTGSYSLIGSFPSTIGSGISGLAEEPIPEPTTMLLLGSGLIGLAGYGRKKFFKK